jgi:hypothetical protein
VSKRHALFSYIGASQAALVAGGFAVAGKPAQAAVFVVGCLFLIYWGRRLDKEGGDG